MKLHRSQTLLYGHMLYNQFETPMKLHRSQTVWNCPEQWKEFETPMKLHRSQTQTEVHESKSSLRPL